MNMDFWKGKKVLVTGNTGFKGAWLSEILINAGAEVYGYALKQEDPKAIFNAICLSDRMKTYYNDISDFDSLAKAMKEIRPEVIFHLAAQPIVRTSYVQPIETFQINVMGTANVLEAIRYVDTVRSVVIITTDKVYDNKENGAGFVETDPLGGYDPYSASKACAEIVVDSYRKSFFPEEKYSEHKVSIVTVRAGNVIGGGDFAKDRLIPDVIRAVSNNEKMILRNPESVRPWQNVLEPLNAYILLAEKLYEEGTRYSGSYNIGPEEKDCIPVGEVVDRFQKYFDGLSLDQYDAEKRKTEVHEAGKLFLNTDKIKKELGFNSVWELDECIKQTARWYKEQLDGSDMREITDRMIKEYFLAK